MTLWSFLTEYGRSVHSSKTDKYVDPLCLHIRYNPSAVDCPHFLWWQQLVLVLNSLEFWHIGGSLFKYRCGAHPVTGIVPSLIIPLLMLQGRAAAA
jgi:hypothetical protein